MQFVAIAPNQWDGQWMNRQHMMWAVKEHAPVLYVQEPEPWYTSRKPRDEHFFRPQLECKTDTLSVLRLPKALCRRGRQGKWNAAVDRRKAAIIRRTLTGASEPQIVYFWHPELYQYVDLLKPALSIFHVYDRVAEYHEPRFAGQPVYEAFQRACQVADIILVGTAEQAAIIPNHRAEIVPNGVAFDWYDRDLPEPEDIASIPRPRIGYAGSISRKLDFNWFESLASQSRYHLVLVGPVGNLGPECSDDFERLQSLSNVHYLGPKPATELPAYIKSFDAGLVNYRRGIHSEAASPLKLFEYAAAGLPIVAARTQALSSDPTLAGLVHLVDGPEEAVAAVEQALRDEYGAVNTERRKNFARENSWQERARRVIDLAVTKLESTGKFDLPARLRNRNRPGPSAVHAPVGMESH